MTLVRLSKLMSQKNICSRREADQLIESKQVLVNGEIVDILGTKVDPSSKITVKKKQQKFTILLNKPLGIVSCMPEKDYEEALSLIYEKNRDLKFPTNLKFPSSRPFLSVAGRLDINSKGLLVLTNDGVIAKQLIGENTSIEKEYLVRVEGIVTDTKIEKLKAGLILDNRALKGVKVDQIDTDFLRLVLKEGRKRQIRRMCEMLNLHVTSIKRVRIGNVRLSSLKEGYWRFLEPHESF